MSKIMEYQSMEFSAPHYFSSRTLILNQCSQISLFAFTLLLLNVLIHSQSSHHFSFHEFNYFFAYESHSGSDVISSAYINCEHKAFKKLTSDYVPLRSYS